MAASLTIIAIKARKAIRYGIIGFVVIVIGRIALIGIVDLYRNLRPSPPPPPTVNFGRLSELPFPDLNIELPELAYTIETPSGALPQFPNQMPIYYMPRKTGNLFSIDRMTQKANALGYTRAPIEGPETIFTFTHPEIPSTMTADSVNETFSLSFDLAADSSPLNTRAPDVTSATQIVRSRLRQANSLPEDLVGPVTNEFLRVEGLNLVTALALSDAQLTKINLYRQPVNLGTEDEPINIPNVTANSKEGNVWFILSGSRDAAKALIAGEYRYFPIDRETVETYPIKTAAEAFEDLKAGGGYVSNLGLNTNGQIVIREVFLAYYDPNVPYDYYQPVVVFKGDGEFEAYVPAVTREYYGAVSSE